MKIEPTNARDIVGSVAFRLLALLTLALTPIGAIAVYQNTVLSEELETRAKDELLNDTLNAVSDVRRVFERAFGAAEALGAVSSTLASDPAACRRLFRRFVGEQDHYSYAGILDPSGSYDCASSSIPSALSNNLRLQELQSQPLPFVLSIDRNGEDEEAQILIGQPVVSEGQAVYFVVVSIPRRELSASESSLGKAGALSISTYSASGEVLLSSDSVDSLTSWPEGLQLTSLTLGRGAVFEGETLGGEARIFSTVPVFGSYVYAVAGWPMDRLNAPSSLSAWIFPIVMWLATLAVTYLALHRLVIRHVRTLGRQMRRFARNRTLPELGVDDDQPAELLAMHSTFRAMAEEILHDEAELENAIHEKNGLIREVHHRVKNNLQLIASIMNMQIRKSRNSETSHIVKRLQDRVLGLAAIHRQMYQAQSMADIPVDRLLDEALRQTVNLDPSGKVAYSRSLVSLHLNSDQAVPLALLASEATLNAVKYVSAEPGEKAWIEVTLRKLEGDLVQLEVSNSQMASDREKVDDVTSSEVGLGTQLMRAFASQLEGKLEICEEDGVFRVRVTFSAKEIDPEFLPTGNQTLSIKTY